MKISVTRSGGFAGLTEEVGTVDTAKLDPAAAQKIEQLLAEVGFFNLPATLSGEAIGADMFHYEITASDGERQHTVAFDDDGSPQFAPLRQLVETVAHMG